MAVWILIAIAWIAMDRQTTPVTPMGTLGVRQIGTQATNHTVGHTAGQSLSYLAFRWGALTPLIRPTTHKVGTRGIIRGTIRAGTVVKAAGIIVIKAIGISKATGITVIKATGTTKAIGMVTKVAVRIIQVHVTIQLQTTIRV
jgi:hypothetical protein